MRWPASSSSTASGNRGVEHAATPGCGAVSRRSLLLLVAPHRRQAIADHATQAAEPEGQGQHQPQLHAFSIRQTGDIHIQEGQRETREGYCSTTNGPQALFVRHGACVNTLSFGLVALVLFQLEPSDFVHGLRRQLEEPIHLRKSAHHAFEARMIVALRHLDEIAMRLDAGGQPLDVAPLDRADVLIAARPGHSPPERFDRLSLVLRQQVGDEVAGGLFSWISSTGAAFHTIRFGARGRRVHAADSRRSSRAGEYSRLGESGKGFAVVASEVKNLARQTAQATDGIGRMVENIQGGTNEVIKDIGSVHTVIAEISRNAQASPAGAEETRSSADELSRLALQLEELVKAFDVEPV